MHISKEQAQKYLDHHKMRWLTVDDVLANEHLQKQASYVVYAGDNVMAHHGSDIHYGGLDGAMQLFIRLGSVECAKHRAGAWLVSARWNRARGDIKAARTSLINAMECRRFAASVADRSTLEQPHNISEAA